MNLDEQITQLEASIKGELDDNKEKDLDAKVRAAMVKKAVEDMSDEEKKEARKAFDESEPEEDEDEEQKESKGKKSKEHDEGEDDEDMKKALAAKDKQIQALVASINSIKAQPIIDKMLTARKHAGMSEEAVAKFKSSLYGKSLQEIQSRYDEDKMLFASESTVEVSDDIPFNGQGLTASDKTLEELLS